ncbi:FAD-dependent monooxygenase [Kiloniella laminariae]|uniref:FAD-dependent monooxygenase n=1 Tax=Kiloniella laminariae TaxID=454162 RepID=UPI0003A8C300|nr:FAD-dependent monooxygenase [Kiloniella laminariae]
MSRRQMTDSSSRSNSSQSEPVTSQVQIVGGGLAGLSLAAALGSAGITTLLIDQEAPASTAPYSEATDNRTTALILNSINLLKACGAWEGCEEYATALTVMRIINLPRGRQTRASSTDFDSRETETSPFGYNVPNAVLRQVLCQRLSRLSSVTHLTQTRVDSMSYSENGWLLALSNGSKATAQLTVGADGKNSFCRKTAGIRSMSWPYPQTAITCYIEHSKPHQNISTETHYPAGPFTLVPMMGKRSSIVWVEETRLARKLLQQDDQTFSKTLIEKIGGRLGNVKLFGHRGGFPLSAMLSNSFHGPRLALVAEAAHALPPIAAQGLNLSLRDIAVLAEALIDQHNSGQDLGDSNLLENYDRARRLDVVTRMAAADGLNRFASNDSGILHGIRGLGLAAIRNFPPLRQFMMNTGMRSPGGTPALMSGKEITPE